MAEIYQCANCDNEVKYGAKFCDECGTKLEWPKEKTAKVKVAKTKKKAKKVKLGVDAVKVEKLCKNCIYTIVIMAIGCAFNRDWNVNESLIIPILLIGGLLGAAVASPIFFLRIGISKWLKSVKDPDNNSEYPTEKMLGRVKGIIVYTTITCALITLSLIGTLTAPEKPKNYFDKTDYVSLKKGTIMWDACYLISLGGLALEAFKVIGSSKNGKKYEYDPNKQQEIKNMGIMNNPKQETAEGTEDEEEFF